jgi:glyoxylase-like metal-dependent hydrolase (beta-lactamase superfamily II)
VNGLTELLTRHDVPAYISAHEADYYKPKNKQIMAVEDGQKLKVGNIEFECILTPGHTPGGQCFRYENVLITGDTLFIDGCGRCDLPGGNARELYKSLHHIITKLPDDTLLFTGHNYGPVPYATIAAQKKTNPYLQCNGMNEFLQHRLGISL